MAMHTSLLERNFAFVSPGISRVIAVPDSCY